MKSQRSLRRLIVLRIAPVVVALLAVLATSFLLPSLHSAHAATCTSTSSNKVGTDGYYYSFWTAGSGSATMTECNGGYYNVYWSGVGDIVAGKGWATGSSHTVGYSGSFNPSGVGLLSLYGWSTSPLVEYYIVENWNSYNPGSGAVYKGTVTSDGSVYDLYENTRYNAPSIIGTATFNQYLAVRVSRRTGGNITTANFFNAWASHGMYLGAMNEQIMATESFNGGSGNAAITVWG